MTTCKDYTLTCTSLEYNYTDDSGYEADLCLEWSYECDDTDDEQDICLEAYFYMEYSDSVCTAFGISCTRELMSDEYCMADCAIKSQLYTELVQLDFIYELISKAAYNYMHPLLNLYTTHNLVGTDGSLITLNSIIIEENLN